jgi:hypothetical protein
MSSSSGDGGSTFVNQPITPKLPSQQQPQPPSIPVGFFVNQETYDHYLEVAKSLHSQMGIGADGSPTPLLEKPEVNYFVAFAVSFFLQSTNTFKEFQANPKAARAMKMMMKIMKGIM